MRGARLRRARHRGRHDRDRTGGRVWRTATNPDLQPDDQPKTGKLRLHIDINPTDRDQDAELERLLEIGARPADIGQTGEEQWHVLLDPEGNEFCLLRRRLS